MDDGYEFIERLHRSAEWRRFEQFEFFTNSFEVFHLNYRELLQLIHRYQVGKYPTALYHGNETEFRQLSLEIFRLVFNFLASAVALIDHTRVVYNRLYESSGAIPEYQNEINSRFGSDPLSRFIKELRHFVSHTVFPGLNFSMHSDREKNSRSYEIAFLKSSLLEFGWKEEARRYLSAQPEKIPITDVFKPYFEKVSEFYRWFLSRANGIHDAELREFIERDQRLSE